jgi:multidrug resistance efflux pump
MLIVLSFFFAIVWLIFFKFQWLPWSRGWKVTVYTAALSIALVVVGALQYYTPVSKMAVVEARAEQVYPLVSGQVDRVYVQGAQSVSAGDKLFSIDPRPFQYAVDNWAAATKLAELELSDARKLVKTGAIAAFALDQKQAQYDQARAQLENARYQLENAVIHAPADGYITLNSLRPGQRVNSRTAALTFIDTGEVFIAVIVKQNGLSGIVPGKKATVTFTAAPGQVFQSEVIDSVQGLIQGQITVESAASPVQAITGASNAYPIRVAFPADAPAQLRQPGKLAQVTVFTDEGNPINVLAKILQWISTWMDFIL